MIRFIAAIDSNQGMADDAGIPWRGKLPGEVVYFRKQLNGTVLMGYTTYTEYDKPVPGVRNVVANDKDVELRDGFELTTDAGSYLKDQSSDVWVIGGPGLFAGTIDLAGELYLTQIEKDFGCTKFFPEFKSDFVLKSESKPAIENGTTYRFQVWARQ